MPERQSSLINKVGNGENISVKLKRFDALSLQQKKLIFKILLSRSVQTPNSDKNWQTSCPLQVFVCNISRHLEFMIEQGHRVNGVSGSLDSRVTGSQNVTQFHVWYRRAGTNLLNSVLGLVRQQSCITEPLSKTLTHSDLRTCAMAL